MKWGYELIHIFPDSDARKKFKPAIPVQGSRVHCYNQNITF